MAPAPPTSPADANGEPIGRANVHQHAGTCGGSNCLPARLSPGAAACAATSVAPDWSPYQLPNRGTNHCCTRSFARKHSNRGAHECPVDDTQS